MSCRLRVGCDTHISGYQPVDITEICEGFEDSTPDRLRAKHTDSPIDFDGVLDEEAWTKAPRISNFTQRELKENMLATENTNSETRWIIPDGSGQTRPWP